jgi:hypothetical protein
MSHMLGATELLELGRARSGFRHEPFLAQRRAPLGDALSSAAGFLVDALGTVIGVIADIVAVPTEILVSGIDVVFSNVSALLREIPLLGELAAQAMLAAGAILKWTIQVPQMALEKIANLFEGLSDALEQNLGEEDRKNTVSEARSRIIGNAPPQARDQVARMLPTTREEVETGAHGTAPTEGLLDALKVGVPLAIGAGALALIVAS